MPELTRKDGLLERSTLLHRRPLLQTWACLYMFVCSSTWDWWLGPRNRSHSWNGWGRRLAELTEGCYSEGDSQGLLGWIKFTPCPCESSWDTHYQFSIKTLLSKTGKCLGQFLGCYMISRVRTTRPIQCLSWVFKTQERKRKNARISTRGVSWPSVAVIINKTTKRTPKFLPESFSDFCPAILWMECIW